MNQIVIYTSKTGFTEKYAQWIAKELDCEVKRLKDVDLTTLSNYDRVIYGGWVMGGMIMGLDKMQNVQVDNLVVFATGMSAPCQDIVELILKQNKIKEEQLFYLEGGYSPKKVGFAFRLMVNMVTGSVRKKEVKTEDELRMLETVKGMDRTDKSNIKPMIEYLKSR